MSSIAAWADRIVRIFAIGFCAFLVPTASATQDLPTVHIACPPADAATPALYAIQAGLFRRAGLNVEMTAMSSGGGIVAAVAGGSIQIGTTAVMPLVIAHSKGITFPIVAPNVIHSSRVHDQQMIVRSDSTIRTGADLNGKTASPGSLNDSNAISLLAWIDQHGGDSHTVKLIELPYPSMPAALEEHRIDLATMLSPLLQRALESGKVRSLGSSHDAIAKEFLNVAWFANADYAAANPDIIRRFAAVMRQANVYANTHHAETVPIAAAFNGVDPSVVARSTRQSFGTTLNPGDLQPLIDFAARYKVIDKAFNAQEIISPVAQAAMQ